jgi:hypothetical protein
MSRVDAGPRGMITFQHALVIAGQIAGTWKTIRAAGEVVVDVIPLRRLTKSERQGLHDTAIRYGQFLGTSGALKILGFEDLGI